MRKNDGLATCIRIVIQSRGGMSTKSVPKLQRRKSAQGRLQSSTPAAHASSDGGHETHCQGDRERSDGKGRWRRAKSAREPRTLERESSAELAKGGGWGSTQYGDDFGHKQPLTPVPVRPFSPTRRNNPHPAKVCSHSSPPAAQFDAHSYSPNTNVYTKSAIVIYSYS